VSRLVEVFREVRRVLADDGTLWLNLGDSYWSVGPKGDTHAGFNARYFGRDNVASDKQAQTFKNVPALRHAQVQRVRGSSACDGNGLKPKDLVGIPWRVAFALQADGWYLRSDIIWAKPNPMPESVTDRPTKAHEYLFLFAKSQRYYYDAEAIKEGDCGRPAGNVDGFKSRQGLASFHARTGGAGSDGWEPGTGRNRRSVWSITPKPFKGAHFAVMPEALVEPCILAGSAKGDYVLDPFVGSGTVPVVAKRYHRNAIGIDLNPEYVKMARRRVKGV
jgi:DNA modification methylase